MPRVKKTDTKSVIDFKNSPKQSLFQKIQAELQLDQSYSNLILGLLIILVGGILVFNYFKKNQPDLGPAQQVTTGTEESKDVEPSALPGSYTVKDGDTLFAIAEKYYRDGYKFVQIAEINKLANVNLIEKGQVLQIPKLEGNAIKSEPTITETPDQGTGGAINQTIWGEAITEAVYTVAEGDWLSKIAGRAYGDIMAFDKIVKANNISNPDLIEPGTVLTIPR